MATGKMDEAVAFAAEMLRKDPDTPMSEIKAAAAKKGINIYPLVMGKAKTLLGMGRATRKKTSRKKSSKKSSKKKASRKKSGARRGPGRPRGSGRGPGRPRGSGRGPGRPPASADPSVALDRIAGHLTELESELADLRDRLQKIADIAAG